MISLKELPKIINKVELKVENNNEYQIKLNDETLDIKSFYLTDESNPLASKLHGDCFDIVINSEFLKINNDYINQVLVGLLKKIKYQHIVITNIRFINEKMINQLLSQPSLEIIEFKNMMITRPMITRLRFLKTLKTVIGQDIEDVAYKELLERGIDALTITKIPFKSDLFKAYSLSKSSAIFMNNLIINDKYDDLELDDFGEFLKVNYKLSDIYLRMNLDLYFIKDIIAQVHKSNHKKLRLIINDSNEVESSVNVLTQLNNAFGEHNKIYININNANVDIDTYQVYLETLKQLQSVALPLNLTTLEKLLFAYELVNALNIKPEVKILLLYNFLKKQDIHSTSILDNKRLLIKVLDVPYQYSGLLVLEVGEDSVFRSSDFLYTPSEIKNTNNPLFEFLSFETHQGMKEYLDTTYFENIMIITKTLTDVLGDEYNFKHLTGSTQEVDLIKDTLEQIYVQNRTNEFDKKLFFKVFCNLRQKTGKTSLQITEEIKAMVIKTPN